MAQYSFTCPLQGCSQTMTSDASNQNDAAKELVEKAKQHLKDVHPDIQKSDEEIDKDIRSHMVSAED